MASRAARVRLAFPRPFVARALHTPARPRLPFLRTSPPRTALPRTALPLPPRRLISAQTKAYIYRETLIAARVVAYGYTAILLTALTFLTTTLLSAESTHPTPPTLPLKSRTGIALARVITSWTHNHPAAIEALRGVIADLQEHPYDRQPLGWKAGYLGALRLLAELEELNGDQEAARGHWRQVCGLPREDVETEERWAETRVSAALRLGAIAEAEGDVGGARRALEDAVGFALPGVRGLPEPGERGNTVLLMKALTELGVFHARRGEVGVALDLFTRVLAARRGAERVKDPGDSGCCELVSDPCAEAATMTYIGEVVFAMGERRQGVAWTREAFERSVGLAELRGRCRECALVAGRNVGTMLAIMEAEGGEKPRWGRFFGRGEGGGAAVEGETVEKWQEAVALLEKIRISRGV